MGGKLFSEYEIGAIHAMFRDGLTDIQMSAQLLSEGYPRSEGSIAEKRKSMGLKRGGGTHSPQEIGIIKRGFAADLSDVDIRSELLFCGFDRSVRAIKEFRYRIGLKREKETQQKRPDEDNEDLSYWLRQKLGSDKLLVRLREVHGEPRYDLVEHAPQVWRAQPIPYREVMQHDNMGPW